MGPTSDIVQAMRANENRMGWDIVDLRLQETQL
jgi:hypothetical protein